MSYTAKDAFILSDIYEGLVTVDAAGNPAPGASDKWTVDATGKVYTFHLRDGLVWATGAPLTARDFVYAMKRMLDPATASSKVYRLTSSLSVTGAADFNAGKSKDFSTVGIKAPDDRTVEIRLDQPNPHALSLLDTYTTSPVPDGLSDPAKFIDPSAGLSNGAYMLKEVVPQSHVLLVKNPNYWDAANVKVPAVRYSVVQDVNTELKLFQAGSLAMTSDVPPSRIADLRKTDPAELHVPPKAYTEFVDFNTDAGPLADIRVRKALTLAIDRDTLENQIVKAGSLPLDSYVPPVESSYPKLKPAGMTGTYKQDLVLAHALLGQAGYGPDKPITVKFECFGDETWKRRAEAIAVMWKQGLGVVSVLHFQEYKAHWDAFSAFDWGVYCDALTGDYAAAEPFVLYRTKAAAAGYKWDSPKFEAFTTQAVGTTDPAGRNALLASAEQVLLDDYILAPLEQGTARRLISTKVVGWVDNPPDLHLSRYLSLTAN